MSLSGFLSERYYHAKEKGLSKIDPNTQLDAKSGCALIHIAAHWNSADDIKTLAIRGADINARMSPQESMTAGGSALEIAACFGRYSAVKTLLRLGAVVPRPFADDPGYRTSLPYKRNDPSSVIEQSHERERLIELIKLCVRLPDLEAGRLDGISAIQMELLREELHALAEFNSPACANETKTVLSDYLVDDVLTIINIYAFREVNRFTPLFNQVISNKETAKAFGVVDLFYLHNNPVAEKDLREALRIFIQTYQGYLSRIFGDCYDVVAAKACLESLDNKTKILPRQIARFNSNPELKAIRNTYSGVFPVETQPFPDHVRKLSGPH